MKMNFIDLKLQYKNLKSEIQEAINRVLDSSQFILGPDVTELEKEIATFVNAKFGIGASSGTDALYMAMLALDIGPGDEVITTPFTFIATAEVIALVGAKPVFVDIDPKTYNIDVTQIENKITEKTKAIIPVHLYGQAADMDSISSIAKKHNLYIIEDAAQAIGAEYKNQKVCSLGDIACLSFFPSKNLGGFGDGGMVVTNNETLSEKLRQVGNHGQDKKYSHKYIGINGRLDTLQAAILRVKLKYLNQWIEQRIKHAEYYIQNLKDLVETPYKEDFNKHVYNQFTIRTSKRDELQKHCIDNGIPIAVHYPIPLHFQNAFSYLGYKKGDFPVAEQASLEVMSLPMFPEITESQQDEVISTIKDFFKE